MSTMQAQHGHSAACCNIPPIISKDYKIKGKYETIGGVKTYVTGPSDAKTAIFVVMDIFGFFNQTLQGCDILATSDKDHQYQVFMPDFFDGKPLDISLYPPTDEDKQKKVGEFFQTTGAPPAAAEKIPGLVKDFEKYNPSIKSWGVVGYCWGSKVISITCAAGGVPWKAIAVAHPAMVDPADAQHIKVPYCMLPSQEEDKETVEKFQAALTVPSTFEFFPDQIHGFMAARSDLEDPKVKKEYERGYGIWLDHMAKYL